MDRLSSLPDDIVLHILPFLDETKSFVRFSAVSKQWKAHLSSRSRDFFFDESLSPSHILSNPWKARFNGILRNGLACPSLKTLSLNRCSLGNIFSFPTVTRPKLVRLSVEYKRPSKWGITKISAPGLEYFSFVVDHSVEIEYFPAVDDFPSLQCAVIDAAHPTGRFDLIEIIKFLRGLHNAEYLSLSPTLIQALSMVPGIIERQPSPFARLKTLTLLENPGVDFLHIPDNALVYLLGGSTSAKRKG
ncbi:hypothetical protein Tsubulata_024155 [Turnera subulata]|uniref:F-box domain-containing protein n=1 Tax=Turnera subulata TaxID=218843 RepID=A0A9Q0GIM1_9ROSI|nr:hypothetical protein Tsubulata_024155 [Turnera subulata]